MMTRPRSSPLAELIFGCFFTLLGTAVLLLGLSPTYQALQMRSWVEVPCVIERFEISDHPDSKPAFRPEVSFRYRWQGKSFTSTQLWPGHVGEEDYESLAELRTRLGPEFPRSANCRINPDHPDQGALVPAPVSGSPIVIVGFCGVFIAIGISTAQAGWLRLRGRPTAGPDRLKKLGVFAAFLAMGGFFIWSSLNSLRVDCSSWVPTPATMIWSRLETIQSKRTSYRVNVFYRYRFGGREYGSSVFDVASMNTSSKDSKEAFVKAHPSGASFTCFVNPHAPWQSVVDRDHRGRALTSLVLGLAICGVGVWYLRWASRTP
jgi:hypothetical protein